MLAVGLASVVSAVNAIINAYTIKRKKMKIRKTKKRYKTMFLAPHYVLR